MTSLRTVFSAVLLAVSLPAAAPAFELDSVGAADIEELSSGLEVPRPKLAFSDAILPKSGLDPVVITIPGLKFGEIGYGSMELRNVLRFVQFFFRDKDISETDIVNGIVGFSPRYFFPGDDDYARELELRDPSRLADNYLEEKLKEIPGYDQHNVIVVPFAWSRDPGDTKQTLPLLQAKIAEIYDAYRRTGRPVYILAHSWGSVLAHTALHRVAAERPDVRIDKLITAGSPLVPGNFVVKMFIKVEVVKEKLEKKVRKPANVGVWSNIWAMRDAYSNEIPAADSNFQADAEVENVEPTLIQLILHNKLLKKQARRDLFKIRDIKAWHGAYFFDYQAVLDSIQKEISVQVFRPVLAPQVVDCAKSPSAPLCAH
ncbi:MAG: lipase/acyltransferase domain-containing protein [Elusimicrobiales bacterium]